MVGDSTVVGDDAVVLITAAVAWAPQPIRRAGPGNGAAAAATPETVQSKKPLVKNPELF